jgi:hypothetical protein
MFDKFDYHIFPISFIKSSFSASTGNASSSSTYGAYCAPNNADKSNPGSGTSYYSDYALPRSA